MDGKMMANGGYGVPALAYLGDAVFELETRKRLVSSGISSSGELNRAALGFVTAQKQGNAILKIIPILTEEEEACYRRGKNHKNQYHPKGTDLETYRRATGFEVLLASLYLGGKYERIEELYSAAFNIISEETK